MVNSSLINNLTIICLALFIAIPGFGAALEPVNKVDTCIALLSLSNDGITITNKKRDLEASLSSSLSDLRDTFADDGRINERALTAYMASAKELLNINGVQFREVNEGNGKIIYQIVADHRSSNPLNRLAGALARKHSDSLIVDPEALVRKGAGGMFDDTGKERKIYLDQEAMISNRASLTTGHEIVHSFVALRPGKVGGYDTYIFPKLGPNSLRPQWLGIYKDGFRADELVAHSQGLWGALSTLKKAETNSSIGRDVDKALRDLAEGLRRQRVMAKVLTEQLEIWVSALTKEGVRALSSHIISENPGEFTLHSDSIHSSQLTLRFSSQMRELVQKLNDLELAFAKGESRDSWGITDTEVELKKAALVTAREQLTTMLAEAKAWMTASAEMLNLIRQEQYQEAGAVLLKRRSAAMAIIKGRDQ